MPAPRAHLYDAFEKAQNPVRRPEEDERAVSDGALLAAWRDLGRLGIFSEPSGAISLADVLVLNVTGTGFKDFETLLANIEVAAGVAETFEEMERRQERFETS